MAHVVDMAEWDKAPLQLRTLLLRHNDITHQLVWLSPPKEQPEPAAMWAPVLFTPELMVVHASWLLFRVTTAMEANGREEGIVSS